MKPRVLLDMDGVIANFYMEFANFLNKEYGCTLDIFTDPTSYSFGDWGHGIESVPMDEASDKWIRSGGLNRIPAYDGASDFVRELSNLCNVYIVTARIGDWQRMLSKDILETIKKETKQWLIDNDMPEDQLFFSHKKIDFCNQYGISIMIEDKFSTALEASKNGIHTILMNRGYNGSQIDRFKIYRAYDFKDALEKLRKITP